MSMQDSFVLHSFIRRLTANPISNQTKIGTVLGKGNKEHKSLLSHYKPLKARMRGAEFFIKEQASYIPTKGLSRFRLNAEEKTGQKYSVLNL